MVALLYVGHRTRSVGAWTVLADKRFTTNQDCSTGACACPRSAMCCYYATVLLFCMVAKFSIFFCKLAAARWGREACSRVACVLG
jgi:hypothetical protein